MSQSAFKRLDLPNPLQIIKGGTGSMTGSISGTSTLQFDTTGAFGIIIKTLGTGSITLGTNGTTRVTIDSAGNVGIGVASAAYKLEVAGSIKADALYVGAESLDARYATSANPVNLVTNSRFLDNPTNLTPYGWTGLQANKIEVIDSEIITQTGITMTVWDSTAWTTANTYAWITAPTLDFSDTYLIGKYVILRGDSTSSLAYYKMKIITVDIPNTKIKVQVPAKYATPSILMGIPARPVNGVDTFNVAAVANRSKKCVRFKAGQSLANQRIQSSTFTIPGNDKISVSFEHLVTNLTATKKHYCQLVVTDANDKVVYQWGQNLLLSSNTNNWEIATVPALGPFSDPMNWNTSADAGAMVTPTFKMSIMFKYYDDSTGGPSTWCITGVTANAGSIPYTYAPHYISEEDPVARVNSLNLSYVANPTGITGSADTTGGSLGLGNYYYLVTYTTKTPIGETGAAASAIIATTAGNKTIALSVPISPDPRVTGRKIYRTKVGESVWQDYLLATINDNTTTVYVDNKSDANLLLVSNASEGQAYFRANTTSNGIQINNSNVFTVDTYLTKLGSGAGLNITSGGRIVLVGGGTGASLTTAKDIVFVGHGAGGYGTSASGSIAIGSYALARVTSGSGNIAIGYAAMQLPRVTSANNTVVGYQAGCGIATSEYFSNSLFGYSSGYALTLGNYNLFAGYQAGYAATNGSSSVFLGCYAGKYETQGSSLYIDSLDRTDLAGEKAKSLIYGIFDAMSANQRLTINGNVGIQTPAVSTFKLKVNGDFNVNNGSVLFNDTTGVTPISGVGVRMMWVPRKRALRVGAVSSDQWDDIYIGDYSVAMGIDTMATSLASISLGDGCRTNGVTAFAFGKSCVADGNYSFAFGRESVTTSNATVAMAMGLNVLANTACGLAIGTYNLGATNNLFEIGAGSIDQDDNITRLNVFSVSTTGKVTSIDNICIQRDKRFVFDDDGDGWSYIQVANSMIDDLGLPEESVVLSSGTGRFDFICGEDVNVNMSIETNGTVTVRGDLYATAKHFRIPDQDNLDHTITYSSLEGPENAVFYRGRINVQKKQYTIDLPSEWTWLVESESISVNLTAEGAPQKLSYEIVDNMKIVIKNHDWSNMIMCSYLVMATRRDVAPLEVYN